MYNNRKYLIYKHTNLINNKIYIGQTCQKARIRWQYGEGYKHSAHFYAAIKKYGWNNFKHEILYTGLTHEEANTLEIALIAELDTTNPEKGYNSALGGSKNFRYSTEEEAVTAHKKIQHEAYLKMVSNEEYAQLMRTKSLEVYYANKSDPKFQKARAISNKKSRTKVKYFRNDLKVLYTNYSELFTEAEYNIAFGFKDQKNYICNSSKQLQNLLEVLKRRLYEKRKSKN